MSFYYFRNLLDLVDCHRNCCSIWLTATKIRSLGLLPLPPAPPLLLLPQLQRWRKQVWAHLPTSTMAARTQELNLRSFWISIHLHPFNLIIVSCVFVIHCISPHRFHGRRPCPAWYKEARRPWVSVTPSAVAQGRSFKPLHSTDSDRQRLDDCQNHHLGVPRGTKVPTQEVRIKILIDFLSCNKLVIISPSYFG